MTDLTLFVEEVAEKRNIRNPKCVFGSDKVLDEDEPDDEETLEKYKATGSKQVLIAAKVDDIPETCENVEIVMNSLNLPELKLDFKVVAYMKLLNLLLGIQSCTSSFGCPYGKC